MVCTVTFSLEDNIYCGHINVNAEKSSGVEPGRVDPASKMRSVKFEVGVYDNFRHYGFRMPVGIEMIVGIAVFGFHFRLV